MKVLVGLVLLAGCVCAFTVPEIPVKDYFKYMEQMSNRIIEGSPAENGQFPFALSLFSRVDENATVGALCGASIISYNTILTAAHCVQGRRTFRVVAGSIDRLDGRQTFEWTGNPRIHEEYNPENLNFDLAMLRMPGGNRFDFDEFVSAIELPRMNHSRLEGEIATVAGWGLHEDGGAASQYLYHTNVTIISNDECDNYYFDGIVIDSTLCVLTGDPERPNQGTCNGDSGGPLFVRENGEYLQIGVVSFGSSRGCETDSPNGFARTSSFFDWVAYYMGWEL